VSDSSGPDSPDVQSPHSGPERGSADQTLRWTDDHCHIHFRAADAGAIESAVRAAQVAGVERMITVGCDREDSEAAIAAARAHPGVWATAGVHPHESSRGIDGIEALLDAPEVVAVGECGLDFHYDHSPRPDQRQVFADQIALAHAHDLALVIHTREAWAETFDILAAEGPPERTVFHCFTGGPDEAKACLELGAHLSFSGIVTFPSADDVRAAAALCPLDRLLVETDSPYLTPVPHRGKRNESAYVPLVGAGVAAARGDAVETIARAAWGNATTLYRLP